MAKTTAERIALQKKKMEQDQHELNNLIRQHREEERKATKNRQHDRGKAIEELLSDTAKLSKERFKTFLSKTTANEFGKRILNELLAEQEKEEAMATTDGNAATVTKTENADQQSGALPHQKIDNINPQGGETPAAKPAGTEQNAPKPGVTNPQGTHHRPAEQAGVKQTQTPQGGNATQATKSSA
jgi:hypothetical protein